MSFVSPSQAFAYGNALDCEVKEFFHAPLIVMGKALVKPNLPGRWRSVNVLAMVDEAMVDEAKPDKAMVDEAKPDEAELDEAEPDEAECALCAKRDASGLWISTEYVLACSLHARACLCAGKSQEDKVVCGECIEQLMTWRCQLCHVNQWHCPFCRGLVCSWTLTARSRKFRASAVTVHLATAIGAPVGPALDLPVLTLGDVCDLIELRQKAHRLRASSRAPPPRLDLNGAAR